MNGNILMSVAAPPFSSKIGIFLHDEVVWELECPLFRSSCLIILPFSPPSDIASRVTWPKFEPIWAKIEVPPPFCNFEATYISPKIEVQKCLLFRLKIIKTYPQLMNLNEFLGYYSIHPSKIQFSSNRSISHFMGLFLLLFWRKNWAILRKLGATSFLTQIGPKLTQLTLEAMSNIGQSGRMIRQLCLNSGHSSFDLI